MKTLILIFLLFPFLAFSQQGTYAPAAGQAGSSAIENNSAFIMEWATSCNLHLGFQNNADTTLGVAAVGNSNSTIGAADGNVVSLGDGGIATLTFSHPIANTLGADIAIFENSFSDTFLELAHVEISSDGINFFRFPSVSLTATTTQTGAFGALDPTNIYNLAGKYRANYGTPFDFQELDSITGLNIDSISYVRIIDVVGSIDTAYATYDSQGNIINDPWPTAFASSGFDLDAVAVLGNVTSLIQNTSLPFSIYPNPVVTELFFSKEINQINIYDVSGNKVKQEMVTTKHINVSTLSPGVYFIELISTSNKQTKRLIKL